MTPTRCAPPNKHRRNLVPDRYSMLQPGEVQESHGSESEIDDGNSVSEEHLDHPPILDVKSAGIMLFPQANKPPHKSYLMIVHQKLLVRESE